MNIFSFFSTLNDMRSFLVWKSELDATCPFFCDLHRAATPQTAEFTQDLDGGNIYEKNNKFTTQNSKGQKKP